MCTSPLCGSLTCWHEESNCEPDITYVPPPEPEEPDPDYPDPEEPDEPDPPPSTTTTGKPKDKDTTKPTCGTKTGGNTKWKKDGSVEVGITCSDSGSGCKKNTFTKTYSKEAKTAKITITIEDKAGNKTNCTRTYNIFIDKTAPNITFGTGSSKDLAGCQAGQTFKTPGRVTENLSGFDRNSSYFIMYKNYKVGTTPEIRFTPATHHGEKSGGEGFCADKTKYDVTYHLCDIAGNCRNGTEKIR